MKDRAMKKKFLTVCNRIHRAGWLAIALFVSMASAQALAPSKPATEATKAANRTVQDYLDFNDRQDFDNAQRGFIGKPDTLTIKDAGGRVVWDLESYKQYIGLDKPAPDTVN